MNKGIFSLKAEALDNTGQHSALTEGGANTLDVLGIIRKTSVFRFPPPEVTDLKMTRKPFHASG